MVDFDEFNRMSVEDRNSAREASLEARKEREKKSVQRLKELVLDARSKQWRLSHYELGFLGTLERMVAREFGYSDLTDKQKQVYRRIEVKVYG